MQKKDTKKYDFDVAVIGAGPAGIMAACAAARQGLSVVLIEKNSALGKKLLLTGNGRCNLTNSEFNLKELVKNYNNGGFLFHAFSVFGPKEVIDFFEGLEVKTKTEKDKRVFPRSDDAEEVLEALTDYLSDKKIKMFFASEVVGVSCKDKKIIKIILKDKEIKAKKYVLCTGGKSYPLIGSDGFGYKLAEKMGHTIVKPRPALSPIIIKEGWVKNLQGISLKDIKITVFQNRKKQLQEEGEILFTHFGMSGPAVLNISGKVGDLLEKGEIKICIDLFPLLDQEELLKELEDILRKYPNKTAKNILSIFVPERLAEVLLDIATIDKTEIANNISKIKRATIVKILKNIEVTAEDILGFDQAIVTRGGVSLKEIDHNTMKSKIIDNLFFAGEIIDVDGKTGGFNLQMCWSTGYTAGKSCE
ncbi:NAD(P)/FAD-dependent oxidoreductase [Patescibacteria group bacterium]|nr:NAD(P)/FAD-dependent oxidoreductase [Patescibacteria group bacterium]MBU4367719.1 NAD(P)/FAD-dependent oxidoreductase [Patescibacteria group bacterium]MBU4461831.1 NAD(P)/FAD-dependent oxidoreductase [Patescibacteria group bacterium]